MPWIVKNLWLIPALPILAAGLSALAPQRCRKFSASLAIGSMVISFLLSLCAFAHALQHGGHEASKEFSNINWFQFGDQWLQLGWVLDPLTAVMLVMVTFVGLLIFIYSVGYMAHDENFTRFFCFMSLFAGAMLGVVIANSLLLLFISWELVGLTSYLLIGFWYHKPSAAAAAKKAFIVTRIGDVALLLGMVWLYYTNGTLVFYDGGTGCLERDALESIFISGTWGLSAATGIGLLIFMGAAGKSGQVPLHVWLPDAMEGPTPVSALIHAATMVAAGVFLVARMYPIMSLQGGVLDSPNVPATLEVVTWIGAITAVFAASIAVAQNDIKRILAYSTVSQLGYMMMGLGVGGVAVGMFHLITHAFFKALLFMGAGSVIHGCHDEQDIRRMGGLKKYMPVTFATYAIGMLALAGFPLVFSGFWSKDAILHAAHDWSVSQIPFYLGLFGAFLTAFYMTRQVALVFFGTYRSSGREFAHSNSETHDKTKLEPTHVGCYEKKEEPHESSLVMTLPLVMLATCAIGLGFIGTPAWPWFQSFLGEHDAETGFTRSIVSLMVLSSVIVFAGLGLGWWLYGRKPIQSPDEKDVLEKARPDLYPLLANKYFVDELYEATVIRFNAWWAKVCTILDEQVWGGMVLLVFYVILGLSFVSRFFDELVINLGFDQGCERVTLSSKLMSRLQDGRVQNYLRVIGVALVVLVLFLIWGGGK
ncbi:MAG: NADH-quinone oxidoreductase subunit L [Verrucomicrobia bacterium]|nr:NADH-quinone oxidoreductase subunit L [Verrucomicrobiota bacterium]